jgi:hypothetical protein
LSTEEEVARPAASSLLWVLAAVGVLAAAIAIVLIQVMKRREA